MHLAAAGIESPDDPRYLGFASNAFTHAFNVATIGSKSFLVDLSFGQFVLPDGLNEKVKNPDSRVAKALMTHGYVSLTNENLREYLWLTSTEDYGYASAASVDVFDKVEDRGYDGYRPELHPEVGRV